MYVIVVYDVSVKRVNKVCQFLRRFLNWTQNSVFEGELTKTEFERIKIELKRIINKGEDSVIFYVFRSQDLFKKEHVGIKKTEPSFVI
jgi:CRISPR-associated protein Cas2